MKQPERWPGSAPHKEMPVDAAGRLLRGRALLWGLCFVTGALLVAAYCFLRPVVDFSQNVRYMPQTLVCLDEPDESAPILSQEIEGETLRFAIAPVISPERSLNLYEDLVAYLAKHLGRKPVSLYRGSYAETNDLVRYERCDIAFVCTNAFVRGEKEFGMELLVVPEIDGAKCYYSYIIVPESSRAQSLLDLRDKEFASADLMSTTGWLFPAMWLIEQGENPAVFFANHVITGSHDGSIAAVAENLVDGAAVDSIVYHQMITDHPELSSRTRVLLKSMSFGMPPVVVPPGIDVQLREDLQYLLLTMHENAEGRTALERVGIDRFVMPNPEDYESVRAVVKVVEAVL
ncbi:MAG: PhnD/SsuA/transferrin family substrate-binding protein [Nitrospiraceae bacterium]|nr:PhnD/SsuA/transferrin family substrate-binding protein [Nitrospiraceae bacterium]